MRAQTTLDFGIGISIFLIVTVFVLAFVPTVMAPFDGDDQARTVAADRVATNLVTGVLAAESEPYMLDLPCTVEFFSADPSLPPTCEFDQSADAEMVDRTSLDELSRVHVKVTSTDRNLLCWNDADGDVVAASDPGCDPASDPDDIVFEGGPTPPSDRGSVSVARRTASLDGDRVVLFVRVW